MWAAVHQRLPSTGAMHVRIPCAARRGTLLLGAALVAAVLGRAQRWPRCSSWPHPGRPLARCAHHPSPEVAGAASNRGRHGDALHRGRRLSALKAPGRPDGVQVGVHVFRKSQEPGRGDSSGHAGVPVVRGVPPDGGRRGGQAPRFIAGDSSRRTWRPNASHSMTGWGYQGWRLSWQDHPSTSRTPHRHAGGRRFPAVEGPAGVFNANAVIDGGGVMWVRCPPRNGSGGAEDFVKAPGPALGTPKDVALWPA